MNSRTVDYNQVAPGYDRRFTAGSSSAAGAPILSLAQALDARYILEVGCGTARWLSDLRPASEKLYGVDLSSGMLAQARRRDGRLFLVQGRAAHLPFQSHSFDLLYCINALHHFRRPQEFIAEARRLLRPSGALAVVGLEPRHPRTDWYLYHYFTGTCAADLERYPSSGAILDWMVAAGFEQVSWQTAEHIHHPLTGREVLEDPFLDKNASSQLILLTDEAYAAGLSRIQSALDAVEASEGAVSAPQPIRFPVDLHLHILIGRFNRG